VDAFAIEMDHQDWYELYNTSRPAPAVLDWD
jgi:hypothetical protein